MLDRYFRTALLLCMIFLKTFKVVAEIPQPLVESTDVVAYMNYSDEFKAYAFKEKSDDRSLESVEFGEAQVGLFDRIFSSLFTLTKSETDTADIKIEPQILDFQYAAPKETKLKLYEVWVKYRLRISDSKDEELADWVVKGYGKTPTSMLASHLKAFNTASNVALRDVGAQLAIGFRNQPSIKEFLVDLNKPGSQITSTEVAEVDSEEVAPAEPPESEIIETSEPDEDAPSEGLKLYPTTFAEITSTEISGHQPGHLDAPFLEERP